MKHILIAQYTYVVVLVSEARPIKYRETAKHILIARYTYVVVLVSKAPCATRPRIK